MRTNPASRTLSKVLPVLALAPSCVPLGSEFWQGDESSVRIDWTVNELEASASSCEEVLGSRVHLSVSRTPGWHEWWPSILPSWDCSGGEGETGMKFAPGTYTLAVQLRGTDGADKDTYELGNVAISPGENDLGTAAFSIELD